MVQVAPSFTGPQFYDDCLGPIQFGPFARELAQRLPAGFAGALLEIACGTGRLTQALRERMSPEGRLVATDLSAPMLDYARTRAGAPGAIEWQLADALALPFASGSFDAVACGFGFMFPPDRAAALREACRVLRPHGLLLFSVWDRIEANPHALVNAHVVEALFPDDPELRFRTPYDMHDPALLRTLLDDAGLRAVQIDTVRLPITDADPRRIATGQVRGTPRSALIAQKGVPLEDVIEKVAVALAAAGGDPYQGSAQALLVQAHPAAASPP